MTKFFEISWFQWKQLMILDKMRSCMWKLILGFRSYCLICLLGPSGPNVVSRSQTPKSKSFLRRYDFNGLILWFWKKWGPFLWKLELWFWTYSLICVLTKAFGPNCPKLVLRPQILNLKALRSKNFFMSSFIKFCMKQALIFKFYVTFDKVMSVFSQKMVKKPIKILLFGAIPDM